MARALEGRYKRARSAGSAGSDSNLGIEGLGGDGGQRQIVLLVDLLGFRSGSRFGFGVHLQKSFVVQRPEFAEARQRLGTAPRVDGKNDRAGCGMTRGVCACAGRGAWRAWPMVEV